MPFEFRTVVDPGIFEDRIDVGSPVFLIGSCFADNVGEKLLESRLHSLTNPFGVLYNPVSIAKSIERIINRNFCEKEELVFHNNLWHHFDFHGRFNNADQDLVCDAINEEIERAHAFLGRSEFLIITFGSSFVYERNDTSEIVANCHKFPNNFFDRYKLEPDEIVSLYKDLIISLRIFNPNLKVIFTVSPVRHWKDGAHGNQLSKATLLLAIDKLCNLFEKIWYFPAYEIMMDDLRDYRFYEPGMLNPSGQAVDYIWSRFTEVLFSEKAQKFISRIRKIHLARQHRFLNAPDERYFNFIRKNLQLIEDIQRQFMEANLEDDRNYFSSLAEKK
ncbi:GSCFA domain-containing protein [Marinilabilia rubra]|uniref:GSCFA domain-containing protein n=1 Tax=Marinilabilia rubra TaxID=2162893 RepID=A0A2U2B833_9BACT|nr:GSCFA domain-containing protein [Marinilabilia rubra]PWD99212.1 hypothetical protein DDZ16_11485 [Marinilabilia rubra]